MRPPGRPPVSRPALGPRGYGAGVLPVEPGRPGSGDCFEQAGTYQGVNPTVLRAIVWFESKGDPRAVHRNADGSVDIGQAQINSIHFGTLAHYGVPRHALTDACVNIYVAAWLLKQKMVKHGNTWRAIGAYHLRRPRSAMPMHAASSACW